MTGFPKKRLGQNFLIDPNILRKIVTVISPRPQDIIVEIGPGRGALTDWLVQSGSEIHAIEIDKDLIPELQMKFGCFPNFHLWNADALDFDLSTLCKPNSRLRIVGNIPYNITSPIIFKIFDNIEIVQDVTFLVQREIARRISASPNSKDYGILGVLSNYFSTPKLEFIVSPHVFRPMPKVFSAVITLTIKQIDSDLEFRKMLIKTVKTAFNQRRKILSNALGVMLKEQGTDDCPIDLNRRAEMLTVYEFTELSRWFMRGESKPFSL